MVLISTASRSEPSRLFVTIKRAATIYHTIVAVYIYTSEPFSALTGPENIIQFTKAPASHPGAF
jgi:hypothetical protein